MRYVGSSTKGLARPREHFRPCAYQKSQRRMHRWMRETLSIGIIPEIVVIEYVPDEIDLFSVETGWIRYFREIGCKLTNSTGSAAGTGMTGKRHSNETKQKISEQKKGIKFSEESRRNIGNASKGRKYSAEVKARMGAPKKGKARDEETRKKLSESLTGVLHSEERKQRTSEAMKLWWEKRRGGV